ncbi:GTP-binding protein [Tulasnella sp. JGI-2019a]|nr:GTP-binding protein [Tulasnella sp. JGI-2019a]
MDRALLLATMSVDERSSYDAHGILNSAPLKSLTFDGTGSEDVTDFLGAVKRVAITQGRQRDDRWIADYVESCLRGDAMKWFSTYESSTGALNVTWSNLRDSLLKQYPCNTPHPNVPRGPPTPAAAGPGPRDAPLESDPPLPSAVTSLRGFMTDKILILGDSGVGKSSLLQRYNCHGWNPPGSPTSGIYYSIWHTDCGGHAVQDSYWDVSGAGPKSLVPMYTYGIETVWLIYDVTNRGSFNNIRSWYQLLQNSTTAKIRLIGNKIDLWDRRIVSEKEGRDLARALGIGTFHETSAKTNEGLHQLRDGWMTMLKGAAVA